MLYTKCTNVLCVDVALLCALLLLAAGCASTPSRYYTLSAASESATASSDLSVVVGPVSVPAEVDRPQMVVSTGPNQMRVDEFNLWASPLQNNITRVVAENLVVLLGTPHVTLFPQTVSTDADYRVAIEVQRFDSTLGGAAMLDAGWSVRRMKDGRTERGVPPYARRPKRTATRRLPLPTAARSHA